MKTLNLTWMIWALFQVPVWAAKPIQAKVQRVTVYLQGAHLYYTETVSLQAGNNEIIFENISNLIQANTLQASCKGGIMLEVSQQLRYRQKARVTRTYDKEIANVLDSLDELSFEIRDLENKLKVLTIERNMIQNNRLINGTSPKDSLPLLGQSLLFTHEHLNSIYEQELRLDKQKSKLLKRKQSLNERYNNLLLLQSNGDMEPNTAEAAPVPQVLVNIFAEAAGTSQVSFNYFISGAGWIPNYELQANSSSNQLQVKYFASVSQSSGLNWDNTALTLSTSNPMEQNMPPSLGIWYLSFQQFKQKALLRSQSMSNAQMNVDKVTLNKEVREDAGAAPAMAEAKQLSDYIAITENLIRTEYEIKLKYDIQSDGKAHKVFIRQQDMPMSLEFAAVPKLCKDAFLLGRVSNWEDLNIIPGDARVYFDGAFVGEVLLSNISTTDTLEMNLGRDKGIVMSRKKVKEKFKIKTLENERVETRSIEIVLRNTKNMAIEMSLLDQIPVVMGTNEIKVNLLDSDGAELDESTGTLKWHLKLGAKDSKKIVFTYEIRYPKNKPIAGLYSGG